MVPKEGGALIKRTLKILKGDSNFILRELRLFWGYHSLGPMLHVIWILAYTPCCSTNESRFPEDGAPS